jgi:tRNA pseudouridine38-40 synthase
MTIPLECTVPALVIARLTLAYAGTRYAGWQRQPNALGVQEVLETALGRLTGEAVAAVAAGRTDAGVHARGQVVSFALARDFPLSGLVHGTNHHLPPDVRVLTAARAAAGFHARRSAVAKLYLYRVHRGRLPPPECAPYVLAWDGALDPSVLAEAARVLVGEHDFGAFAQAGGAPGPTRRRIFAAAWEERGEELVFRITGEGFLRGMVRALVGTLLEIGAGRRDGAGLGALLAGRPRAAAGPTAPARGLVLERVDYAGDSVEAAATASTVE